MGGRKSGRLMSLLRTMGSTIALAGNTFVYQYNNVKGVVDVG